MLGHANGTAGNKDEAKKTLEKLMEPFKSDQAGSLGPKLNQDSTLYVQTLGSLRCS